ncbi:MAG: aspartyl protease family protein [Terriglobales bacterium]
MQRRLCLAFALCLVASSAAPSSQSRAGKARTLYDLHRPFALIQKVEGDANAPPLYRGAVEAMRNQSASAVPDLNAVIRNAPRSHDAVEAHDLLANMYAHSGRYREALDQVQAALAVQPKAPDAASMLPLLRALGRLPDQTVTARAAATFPMQIEGGGVLLPLTVNAKGANFVADTGAGIDALSRSAAARLGLTPLKVVANIGGIAGKSAPVQVAVAKTVTVGRVQLANVAFLVLPDSTPPFNGLPVRQQGIIGLPLLIALQSIRWRPAAKNFSCGFSWPVPPTAARLAFQPQGSGILTQAVVLGKTLTFTLDSGAQATGLTAEFAARFPRLIAAGRKQQHRMTGVDGSREFSSVVVPLLRFRLAGLELPLHNTPILTTNDNGLAFAGNLGDDLLDQARIVTIDFGSMVLALQ